MNIKLVQISKFLYPFQFIIYHKLNGEHIILNALSCLVSKNNSPFLDLIYLKLDISFIITITLININPNLLHYILVSYKNNL